MTNAPAPLLCHAPSPAEAMVVVRRLLPTDSFADLTALLHLAYRPQVEMGLRPLAGRQTEDVTRARCTSGECFVAVIPGRGQDRIIGTILLQEVEAAPFPPHFLRPDVAHFSLFAVEPGHQSRGIGRLLLEIVEQRSLDLGKTELALSMAEPDTNLMNYYLNRGYRVVEHWRWPYTNYRSAILSKPLRA